MLAGHVLAIRQTVLNKCQKLKTHVLWKARHQSKAANFFHNGGSQCGMIVERKIFSKTFCNLHIIKRRISIKSKVRKHDILILKH